MSSNKLLFAADPDSKRAVLCSTLFFRRLEDGSWVPGNFPLPIFDELEDVVNPAERKALINDLLSSSCEIPKRERAAFEALL